MADEYHQDSTNGVPVIEDPEKRGDGKDGEKAEVFEFANFETVVAAYNTYVFVPIFIHDGETLAEKNNIFERIEFSIEETTDSASSEGENSRASDVDDGSESGGDTTEDEGERSSIEKGHKTIKYIALGELEGGDVPYYDFIDTTNAGDPTNSYIGGEGGVYAYISLNATRTKRTFKLTARLNDITREYTIRQLGLKCAGLEKLTQEEDETTGAKEQWNQAVSSSPQQVLEGFTCDLIPDISPARICYPLGDAKYTFGLIKLKTETDSNGGVKITRVATNCQDLKNDCNVIETDSDFTLVVEGLGGSSAFTLPGQTKQRQPYILICPCDPDGYEQPHSDPAGYYLCEYPLASEGITFIDVHKEGKGSIGFKADDWFVGIGAVISPDDEDYDYYKKYPCPSLGDGYLFYTSQGANFYHSGTLSSTPLLVRVSLYTYPFSVLTDTYYPSVCFFSYFFEFVNEDTEKWKKLIDFGASIHKDATKREPPPKGYLSLEVGYNSKYNYFRYADDVFGRFTNNTVYPYRDTTSPVDGIFFSPACTNARIPFAPKWLNQALRAKNENRRDGIGDTFYSRLYRSEEYKPLVWQPFVSFEERLDGLFHAITGAALSGSDDSCLRCGASCLDTFDEEGDDDDTTYGFKVSVTPEAVPSGQDMPEGETITCVFRADFLGFAWEYVEIGEEVAENYKWLSFKVRDKESEFFKEWEGTVAANELTTERVATLRAYVKGTTTEDEAELTQAGIVTYAFDVEPKEVYDETGEGGVFQLKVTKTASTGDVLFREKENDTKHGEFYTQRYNKASAEGGTILVSLGENTTNDEKSGSFTVYENVKDLNCHITVKQAVPAGLRNPCLRLEPWRLLDPGYAVLFYSKNGVCTIDIYDASLRTLVASLESDYPTRSINKIRCRTVNDVMYVVHPDRVPRKILRTDNEDKTGYNFSIVDCDFELTPTLDEEVDSDTSFSVETIATAATAQVGELCTQNSNGTIFCSGISAAIVNTPEPQYEIVNSSSGQKKVTLSPAQIEFTFNVTDSPSIKVGDIIRGILEMSFKFNLEFKIKSNANASTRNAYYKYSLASILKSTKLTVKSFTSNTITTNAASINIPWYYNYTNAVANVATRAWDFEITNEVFTDESTDESVGARIATQSLSDTYANGIFRRIKNGENDTDYADYFEAANAYGYELIIRESASATSDDVDGTADLFFKEEDTWRIGQTFYLRPKQEAVTYSGALCFSDVAVDFSGNLGETLTPNKPIVVHNDSGGAGYVSPWVPAVGKITLKTAGKWGGTLVVEERQSDGEVVELFRVSGLNGMNNEERSRDIVSRGSDVRVRVASRGRANTKVYTFKGEKGDELMYQNVTVDTGCYWQLDVEVSTEIYFKITAVFNGYCYAKCLSSLGVCFTTDNWAEGAWSTKYGYPRTVAIFQERMVFGGNYKKPTTLWLSKTNDWADFEKSTEDTGPITATAIVDGFDELYWLEVARNSLIVGTAWREWFFGNTGGSGIVTPSAYSFIAISNHGGTSSVDGVIFGGQLVAVKAGGEELRAIDYNAMTEETNGAAISLFAEHLFERNPIKRMAVTIAPMTRLWALTEDGRVMCLTYDKEHDVFAFAQLTFLTGVIDLIAVRRKEEDIVVMVTQKGKHLLLGELDPTEENIWTDDGVNYESVLEPTPLVSDNYEGGVYGHRTIFAGADLYVDEGERFWVKLYGGDEMRVDLGFNSQNKLKKFEREKKIELNANTAWQDEAGMVIRTDYPAPFTVTAVGARVKHA